MSALRAQLAVLDTGTHVLEASAGTGKTRTITTLVAAALALGRVEPSRVLTVTFTRAATAELRVKVRERIAQLAAAFAESDGADDSVTTLVQAELATGDHGPPHDPLAHAAARATLRARLLDALADADAIGVDTIHGWCATLLGQFGDLLGLEPPTADATVALPPAEQLTERGALAAAAAAPLAQWIGFSRRIASAEGLLQVARALLAGIGDVQLVREDGSLVDTSDTASAPLAATCERADALHATLARRWAEDAELFCAELEAARAAGRLNRNKWNDTALSRRTPTVTRLFSDITAYFTLSKDDEKDVRYFGAAELAAAAKKGQAPVSLGTFAEDLDALLALLPEVRAALAVPLGTFVRAVQSALPRRADDFDDLLRLVAEGLEREPTVAQRVRGGADLVLIDESQDTDPLQWRIFATLFHRCGDGKRLVLVGDPKQSIYRFRNAEVAVYLEARREATGDVLTLDTNWRSDPALVTAVNTVYEAAGPVFGAGVTFEPVRAARTAATLTPASATPLTFVAMPSDVAGGAAARARALVADDVARRIAALLRAPDGSRLRLPTDNGGTRGVQARDCAVLVSANAHAHLVVQALRRVGVHAVAASRQAVTQGAMAQDVAALLRALEDPGDRAALRQAALTPLVRPALGLDLRDPPVAILEALDGDAGRRFDEALRAARARWYARGLMDAWVTLDRALSLTWHAAAHPDAERRLTDVRHLLELLAAHETQRRAAPTEVLRWLAERMAERSVDQLTAEELEERLESDEDAVRVLTMHASKGLEFPLVWIPFAWSMRPTFRATPKAPLVRRYDPSNRAVVGIVPVGSGSANDHPVARDELDALALEQQRLLYVALTRARHRCTVHVSDADKHAAFALGRLLGAAPSKDGSGRSATDRARALALPGRGVTIEPMDAGAGDGRAAPPATDATDASAITARAWQRTTPLDTLWRRGSFTALTRAATHGSAVPKAGAGGTTLGLDEADRIADALVEIDPLEDVREPAADEGDEAFAPGALEGGLALAGRASRRPADERAETPRVPLADLPRGRAAGNALHDVFERAVQQRALPRVAASLVPEALRRQGLDAERWSAPLADALERALDVPLVGLGGAEASSEARTDASASGAASHGAASDGAASWPSLRTLASGRTFTELTFDFAVARERDRLVRARHVARVFREHPGGAVPADYAVALAALDFLPLRGLLTGAIDLVARHDARWYLLDYKSNHLGDTLAEYGQDALVHAMTSHHYVLQYHLYLVALHRFLRSRQRDYEYDTHVGGIAYLFVRGLDAAQPGAGVFADRPPRARIEALDRALGDGEPA